MCTEQDLSSRCTNNCDFLYNFFWKRSEEFNKQGTTRLPVTCNYKNGQSFILIGHILFFSLASISCKWTTVLRRKKKKKERKPLPFKTLRLNINIAGMLAESGTNPALTQGVQSASSQQHDA